MASHDLTLLVVRDGAGIGCLSRMCLVDELKAGSVIELNVVGLNLMRPVNFITRKSVQHGKIQEAFIKHVLKVADRAVK